MHKSDLLRKLVAAGVFACSVLLSGADTNAPAEVSQMLLERARQGDAQAQLETGFAYFKLHNPVQAAYWFNASARQGMPAAQYNIGRCYLAGYGVEKNMHQALDFFRLAAAQGLPPAQYEAAKLLLAGIPAEPESAPPRKAVAPDETAAVELLEKASQKDFTPAMVLYAEYLIKNSPRKNPEKIVELLESAIKKQNHLACMLLADFLLSRTDGLRNEKRSRALLTQAADTIPEAMAKLAFAVENGFGAPPDPEKAFALYEKAMQKTFVPLAACRLANYYYSGKYGVRQDINKAVKLYTQAASEGIPEAITQLGICCKNGIGMEQDKSKAFELLFQAAKMDYPPAQYELGRCFADGDGTVADQQGAFYWFNQAAMRGEARGLLESGLRYLSGKGTETDPAKAAAYLEQAYANGMNEALAPLRKARKLVENDDSVKAKALPVFKL